MKYELAIISGYFNPLHIGHLDYMRAAKNLASYLVVIVNNDEQVALKGSIPFMPQDERLIIVRAIQFVHTARIAVDKTGSVVESLRLLRNAYPNRKLVFATGADHTAENTVAEAQLCEELGMDIVYGVGGEKVQSSSKLLEKLVV